MHEKVNISFLSIGNSWREPSIYIADRMWRHSERADIQNGEFAETLKIGDMYVKRKNTLLRSDKHFCILASSHGEAP